MPTSFSDRKGGCATGFAFLAVLAGVSLGITIRLYIDRNKERPEELAQCIVMGIFVPTFIVVSAYLNVVELTTPEWHVRLVLATNSLFAIATGAFAILDGVFQILGTSPPRTTLDTVSLVLNAAQAVLSAVMVGPTMKLVKILKEHQARLNSAHDIEEGLGAPTNGRSGRVPLVTVSSGPSQAKSAGRESKEMPSSEHRP